MAMLRGIMLFIRAFLGDRAESAAENLVLRQQLAVLKERTRRPRPRKWDRIFWVWLSRLWTDWRCALLIVQPETVVARHRHGWKPYWRWKSRTGKVGRPKIDAEIRKLIRRTSRDNPLPAAVAAALEGPVAQITGLMTTDKLDKAPIWNEETGQWELPAKLQAIQGGMMSAAGEAAKLGHTEGTGAVNKSFGALEAKNNAASDTWEAADTAERSAKAKHQEKPLRHQEGPEWTESGVADGRDGTAAALAYQQTMQDEAEKQMRDALMAVMSITDVHFCPKAPPPILHGPGVVFKASTTVFFNLLPAARKDDQLVEVPGGPNPIKIGCPTVLIGG